MVRTDAQMGLLVIHCFKPPGRRLGNTCFFFNHLGMIWIQPGWWLSPSPLKNMTSSVGMMTFPTEWKHKKSSKPSTSIMFIDDFYCCDCWSKYIRLRNEIHISLCSHHPSSLRCVAGHGQIVMRHGPTPGSRTPAVQWKRILNWAIHNCRLYKPHE
jgi:hypothetical protein